jgi:nucleoid-associated protein YgaU
MRRQRAWELVMISKSAIYWAIGLGVAVAAAASPFVIQHLPANRGGDTAAPASPAAVASLQGRSGSTPAAAPSPAASPSPAATASPGAATVGETPAPVAETKSTTQDQVAAAPTSSPSAPKADEPRPAFDVVRVEPTGDAVIAGRASPRAAVELRSDGQVVAQTNADDTGQFAFLPPPFPAGGHRLQLAARSGGAPETLSDAVGIDVPVTALATAPNPPPIATGAGPAALMAKKRIDEPARLTVTRPESSGKFKTPAPQMKAAASPGDARVAFAGQTPTGGAEAAPRVSVLSVETNGDGGLQAKGSADPNALVRLYLNNVFVAEATAGADGRWSLTVERGMTPGAYAIRADQINGANGLVSARAEVPFNYPAPPLVAANTPPPANGLPAFKSTTPQIAVATPAPSHAGATSTPPQVPAAEQAQSEKPTVSGPSSAAAPAKPIVQIPNAAPAGANAEAGEAKTGAATPQPATSEPVSPVVAATQSPSTPADAVVAEVRTTKVVPGDNLWDLSQRYYGWGPHYRTIYAANSGQIRDPALIYPDQIFVVPQTPAD